MRLRPVAALAEIGVVAALYTAVTMVLNPLSYGPLQLRVAEILKPLVIWEPHLIPAFVIGNFLSNLTSPFAGPWELIFMPTANLVGASLCRVVGRRAPAAGAALYAFVIAAAVSLLLSVLLKLRYALLFPGLLASEMILLLLGVPAMQAVRRALEPVRRRWVVAE
ncbi:MAG TPA: QueT transporter family protein [bacterium]|nr:QueT transporter family protein [bacterium]